jgi:HAMP domain-containing protein
MASTTNKRDAQGVTDESNAPSQAEKVSASKERATRTRSSSRSKKSGTSENGKAPASTVDEPGAVERLASALANGDLAADMELDGDAEPSSKSSQRALRELSAMARNMRRTVSRLQRAADSIEDISRRVLEGGRILSLSVSD